MPVWRAKLGSALTSALDSIINNAIGPRTGEIALLETIISCLQATQSAEKWANYGMTDVKKVSDYCPAIVALFLSLCDDLQPLSSAAALTLDHS